MNQRTAPVVDSTVSFLTHGYAWLPDLRRHLGANTVQTRLAGRTATALHGPDAVGFFYDERHVVRRSALPSPVVDTLFGRGAVHMLDGPEHRTRKALFLALLTGESPVAALVERVGTEWDAAAAAWAQQPAVELFRAASMVLTRAVCGWAGVPLPAEETVQTADDMVAMVDGFATAGPRHWHARRARIRQEKRFEELIRAEREAADLATGRDGAGPRGSALRAVALHRDAYGELLDEHTAAVEALNIVRPATAVAWYAVFAAHALHRWPQHRAPLRARDAAYAEAFAHEVRRFYPFVPFIAGLAARELRWEGVTIPEHSLVLLDVYGQHHDPALWPHPYAFDPARFLGRPPGRDALIPQGGGDPHGHRCPGEDMTVALLRSVSARLSRMEYDVPRQDLAIPLRHVPTRPRSGFVISLPPADAGRPAARNRRPEG
ncbi:cytochrome P450 [Streptomyces sp. PR69]|uniref:cytochrome P450 n=1 Tax=Streptomyces sp. PR69 TaxID=2984950 RepID=UPI0022650283|nr:cytochrome P450 [Streptomyces sp. PR69]